MHSPVSPSNPLTPPRRRIGVWISVIAVLLLIAALVAWRVVAAGSGGAAAGGAAGGRGGRGGQGGGGQGVTSVGVATASTGDIPVTLDSIATVTSLATATVKAQVSGYLTAINFREGQTVKKGDVLAQVDPRPYQIALAQYQGQLQKDQASLENARLDLKRYQQLMTQDSTSKQTVDTAVASVHQYEGTVKADQAQVDTQKLNLTYARITSPIDGRTGLRQVDVGNYVTVSDTDGVVVVTQTDPISVVFTLPEDNLAAVLKPSADGQPRTVSAWDRTFTTKLADGTLDVVDNQVDTSTGTVKLRALFKNTDGQLFPNEFVNARLLVTTVRGAVTVPTTAVQNGTPGTFVYLVKSDHTVALRKIATGPSANGVIAVTSGLNAGDVVVVDGADHLSDGAKISIPDEKTAEGAANGAQGDGTKAAGKGRHRGTAAQAAPAA